MQRVGYMCRHVDVSTDLVLMEFSPTRNTTLLSTIDMISICRKSNDTRITYTISNLRHFKIEFQR